MKDKLGGLDQPWHIERYHREEGERRRHKAHCYWNENGYCRKQVAMCVGASHCRYYADKRERTEFIRASKQEERKQERIREYEATKVQDLKSNSVTADSMKKRKKR